MFERNSGYSTVREGGGVEARRFKRVFVEPEADRVLWRHVSILLALGQGDRQGFPGRFVSVATDSCDDLLQSALQIVRILAFRERTDCNVISVRISERELRRSSVRIEVWLLFEPTDERACPLKRQVEIIDTEEQ